MSRLRAALVLGLLAAALAVTSCSRVEEPKVVLREVGGGRLTSEGLELDLVVDVENPNGFGAEIGRMEYTILADGVAVAEGRRRERVAVPARGSSRVTIPFTLRWSGAGALLSAVLEGGDHEWSIEGEVTLHKGPIARTFRFRETDHLPAPVDVTGDEGP